MISFQKDIPSLLRLSLVWQLCGCSRNRRTQAFSSLTPAGYNRSPEHRKLPPTRMRRASPRLTRTVLSAKMNLARTLRLKRPKGRTELQPTRNDSERTALLITPSRTRAARPIGKGRPSASPQSSLKLHQSLAVSQTTYSPDRTILSNRRPRNDHSSSLRTEPSAGLQLASQDRDIRSHGRREERFALE